MVSEKLETESEAAAIAEKEKQKAAEVYEKHLDKLDKLTPTLPILKFIMKGLKEQYGKDFTSMKNIYPEFEGISKAASLFAGGEATPVASQRPISFQRPPQEE